MYLDTAKDRLYIRASDDFARRSCQTVLHHSLRCLLALVAPILPHMAEDAFQNMPEPCKKEGVESVFQAGWGDVPEQWGSVPADELALLEAVIQASPTSPRHPLGAPTPRGGVARPCRRRTHHHVAALCHSFSATVSRGGREFGLV